MHALITGGAGGIAQALFAVLRADGWTASAPGRAELDVTDPSSVARYFDGRSDDLVVCAAGITRDIPLARMKPEDWDAVLEVNLTGAMRCARAALPTMVARGSGHIIFLSSYSALHPPVGQAAYAAAKSALIGLTRSLAREVGCHGVRVNCVLPGFLETKMTASVSAARREAVLNEHVLGRFNTPEQVARFIRCLHTDMPNTSGQVFQLDSRIA
jgi:NAD(P)-dependent dehydrogenase (short-subunit alcohol dehydrogenase family)